MQCNEMVNVLPQMFRVQAKVRREFEQMLDKIFVSYVWAEFLEINVGFEFIKLFMNTAVECYLQCFRGGGEGRKGRRPHHDYVVLKAVGILLCHLWGVVNLSRGAT